MRSIFVRVDYDEPDVDTYRGVCLDKYEEGKSVQIARMNTGNAERDLRFIYMVGAYLGLDGVLTSSSVDHFYQDQPCKE